MLQTSIPHLFAVMYSNNLVMHNALFNAIFVLISDMHGMFWVELLPVRVQSVNKFELFCIN